MALPKHQRLKPQKVSSQTIQTAPLPDLGQGVGLRPLHYSYILKNHPAVGWFEAISENFMGIASGDAGGRPIAILKKIRQNYPVVLHGVSLSIGSVDPINLEYVHRLKSLIERIEPAWISDHLCWTGVSGENLHDLLPLPYTKEVIAHLCSKIFQIQDLLKRKMLFENVSSYLTFEFSEMTEWEFISEISKKTGCGILLDINNIYVNSVNHGFDPMKYLRGIPKEVVGQFHLAGYSDMGTYLLDTHDHTVSKPVWKLYAEAVRRFGNVPTLIEWDDKIPEFPELLKLSQKAKEIQTEIYENKLKSRDSFTYAPAKVDAVDFDLA